ncbi:MAG: hypothetical protein IPL50_11795 [Chitinophagaceae bacterium]|nr:hypothetical protein [Chitinophagaceae bacterium]
MKRQKILFVIPNMQQGGAERVVSMLSNYWSEKENAISIMTFDNEDSVYKLHPAIIC